MDSVITMVISSNCITLLCLIYFQINLNIQRLMEKLSCLKSIVYYCLLISSIFGKNIIHLKIVCYIITLRYLMGVTNDGKTVYR